MIFIGITGGVGAGKTAILSYIEEYYNSRVLLADEIAHDLMEPGTDCYREICRVFQKEDIFQEDGRFDRGKMAEVIFGDEKKREQMNRIVHPAVKDVVEKEAQKEKKEQKIDILVLEAALLIEEQYDKICDELWYIFTTEENRRIRLTASRGYSQEKIDHIFASQLTEDIYRSSCQAVIDNNDTPAQSCIQVARLLQERGILPVKEPLL